LYEYCTVVAGISVQFLPNLSINLTIVNIGVDGKFPIILLSNVAGSDIYDIAKINAQSSFSIDHINNTRIMKLTVNFDYHDIPYWTCFHKGIKSSQTAIEQYVS
jgi:hypothetical protein